jgi:hypothetical protein
VGRLKEKKTPEFVVPEADGHQALLDRLERAETIGALRQGMEWFELGGAIALQQAGRYSRK